MNVSGELTSVKLIICHCGHDLILVHICLHT